MTVKNATEVVVLVENLFGWDPVGAVDDASLTPNTKVKPLWEARRAEAGKIIRAMKRDPKLITLNNLELAANYCFEKRIEIKAPYGLVYRIQEALDHVATPELTSSLAESVQRALAWESQQPAGSSRDEWVTALTRAHGDARAELLASWRAAGRG